MNIIKISLLVSFLFFGFQNVNAQKSKIDKETKKQIRAFLKNPASYRKKEIDTKNTLDNAALKVALLEERYDELKVLNRIYYDSITTLNARIADLEAMDNAIRSTIEENLALEYRIQIGAYAVNDFNGSAGLGNAIKTEIVNGVTKYYVGSFTTPEDAEDFATAIRMMGIDGAFVTKFVDSKRVSFNMTSYKRNGGSSSSSGTVKSNSNNSGNSYDQDKPKKMDSFDFNF